ncbi:MAG: hypothetical protein ACRECA_03045, partial [Pseudolabrys sp.]
ATVTTTSASTLLVLEVTDFRDFMAHHPELAKMITEEGMRRANAIDAGATAGDRDDDEDEV